MSKSTERAQRYLKRFKQEHEKKKRYMKENSNERMKIQNNKLTNKIALKDEVSNCSDTISDAYCRCCFKIFTFDSNRIEMSQNFITAISETFQLNINIDFGSRWICNSCQKTVINFRNFRDEIKFKQDQFSIIVNRNEHENLTEIQKISELNTEDLTEQKSHLAEVIIKEEPVNESIFVTELPVLASPESEHNYDETFYPEETSSNTIENLDTDSPDKKDSKPIVPAHGKKKQCPDCKEWFEQLRIHKETHKSKPYFRCGDCDYRTEVRTELVEHFRLNEGCSKPKGKRRGTCEFCGKNVRDLFEHIQNIHERVKNCFCDLCSYSAYDKKAIIYHIKYFHVPKNVKCSLCDFVTINETRLMNHIQNMHEENHEKPRIKCPVEGCDKTCRTQYQMQVHVKRVHEKDYKFKCEHNKCKRMFYSRSQMLTHFGTIHGPRNIICERCAKTFGSEKSIQRHMLAVHSERRFHCTYCNAEYSSKNHLNAHIRQNHTFEKNIKCNEPGCNASFYSHGSRSRHIARAHRGIVYNCQVPGCKSVLIRRDSYVLHLKNHKDLTKDQLAEMMMNLKNFCFENSLSR